MNTMPPMFLILVFYCFFKLISADCNSRLAGVKNASKEAFVGENVTLPCTNVVKQTNCNKTTWQSVENGRAVEVVLLGKINPEDSERRKRMSLTSKCSLHISNITLEDCGCYTCQQWNNHTREAHDFTFCLYVTKGAPTTKSTTTRKSKKEEKRPEKKSREATKKSTTTTPTTKSTVTTNKNGNSALKDIQTTKSTMTTKKNSKETINNSGTPTTLTTKSTVTTNKNDLEIVIPSVLVVVALSVTTLIVWLICRRRAHKRNNQNSNEHNDEDVTYTELNHNAVKLSKVGTDTKCQETVYSGIKCQ